MKQLLKLKPRGRFFFGGNRSFSDDRQSYYAQSEYFPQQTALLGMLRFALLKKAGALDKVPKEKEKIIGKDFDGSHSDSFGKIKSLSPVFILEENTIWLPAGKDRQAYAMLKYNGNGNGPELTGFNHKEYLEMRMLPYEESGEGSEDKSKAMDHFFERVLTVGNKKNQEEKGERTRKGLDEAFYKDEKLVFRRDSSYRSSFAFGVWVDTGGEDLSGLGEVYLGREANFSTEVIAPRDKSVFEEIEQCNLKFTDNNCKVVLLSNTYIKNPEKLRDAAHFILAGDPVPFKFIRSAQQNNAHFAMNNSRRSQQYYLLERGTVIYPKELNVVKNILDNQAFRTIGYNHYMIQKR